MRDGIHTDQLAVENGFGDSIEFDTDTRTGRMIGNVKMVITSQSKLLEQKQQ